MNPIANNIGCDQLNKWAQDTQLESFGDWQALRYYQECTDEKRFRNSKTDNISKAVDQGIMVEVMHKGHIGYAGTADLTPAGVKAAAQKALTMAQQLAKHSLYSFNNDVRPAHKGNYRSPSFQKLDLGSLEQICSTLIQATEKLKISDKIVNAVSHLRIVDTKMSYWSSTGARLEQDFYMLSSNLSATAKDGNEVQTRTDKGFGSRSYQAGLESFDTHEVYQRSQRIGEEALQLLAAPNCPSDVRDLLLSPEQMLIQIHESIGHPLELDRILGDERNYAGWSFVKAEDFGKLQYGSKLMNITFDPNVPGEYASYAYDDSGFPADKQYLIKDGLLVRGLGGLESQKRSGLPGVSNFRASSWNRAPIDRMANINLEPGQSNLKQMIEQTEKGIFMQANTSWSIDDYRNKFQFGCEYAQLIENGKLTHVVKNPNYRGVTVPFWNSLAAVGGAEEFEVYGTPYCGKGEPSQAIRVGHASPPCLFKNIEVFGCGQ